MFFMVNLRPIEGVKKKKRILPTELNLDSVTHELVILGRKQDRSARDCVLVFQ
jgi:hypothetical protein